MNEQSDRASKNLSYRPSERFVADEAASHSEAWILFAAAGAAPTPYYWQLSQCHRS